MVSLSLVALMAAPLPILATGGGNVGTWLDDSDLGYSTYSGAASVTYNGYVYSLGGNNGSSSVTTVLYAQLNSNGSLGAWTATASLPLAKNFPTAVAHNGYMYVLGGSAGGTYSSSVYYAPINPNGTLGSWTLTSLMPSVNHKGTSIVANGYIYYMGGYTGVFKNTVYYAPLNSNGTVGTWQSTTALPVLLSDATSVTYNSRVYVMGGFTGDFQSAVYTASLNPDGTVGNWATTAALPTAMNLAAAAIYNDYVYVLGGQNGNGPLDSVYYTRILSDGTMNPWQTSPNALPAPSMEGSAVAYNGYLYLISGNDAVAAHSGAYYAALTPGTTTASLTNAVDAKAIGITTPAGTDLTCSSTQTEASQANQDAGYSYPLGLVRLCFTTPSSSNQITVTFATNLKSSQVTARHYNTTTGTYTAVAGAVIAETTLSGQPALSVTYNVADNGPLDEDAALGAITDPIGLAVSIAPSTGLGMPGYQGALVWPLAALSLSALWFGFRRLRTTR